MTNPETLLAKLGYEWWELDLPDERTKAFIASLYTDEPDPVFEHNWVHILTYLKFQSRLFAVITPAARYILVVRDSGDVHFFTPSFTDSKAFIEELQGFGLSEISLLNVSSAWKEKYEASLPGATFTPRSKEEAVYDLSLLTELPGSQFANLRNVRNKLLGTGKLTFESINESNSEKARSVLEAWKSVQGHKYDKDKHEKELFVLDELIRAKDAAVIEVGLVDGKPLSLVVYFPSRKDWGECYMLKGLNRASEGGVHGVSDATYLHVFETLHKAGLTYLNDGEIGHEEGTRAHKLAFVPKKFLQSFDVIIKV